MHECHTNVYMLCRWYSFLILAALSKLTLPFGKSGNSRGNRKKQENSEIFCSRNLMAYICHESFQSDWFLLSGTVKSTQPIKPATFMALNSDNLISYVSSRWFYFILFFFVLSGKNKEPTIYLPAFFILYNTLISSTKVAYLFF